MNARVDCVEIKKERPDFANREAEFTIEVDNSLCIKEEPNSLCIKEEPEEVFYSCSPVVLENNDRSGFANMKESCFFESTNSLRNIDEPIRQSRGQSVEKDRRFQCKDVNTAFDHSLRIKQESQLSAYSGSIVVVENSGKSNQNEASYSNNRESRNLESINSLRNIEEPIRQSVEKERRFQCKDVNTAFDHSLRIRQESQESGYSFSASTIVLENNDKSIQNQVSYSAKSRENRNLEATNFLRNIEESIRKFVVEERRFPCRDLDTALQKLDLVELCQRHLTNYKRTLTQRVVTYCRQASSKKKDETRVTTVTRSCQTISGWISCDEKGKCSGKCIKKRKTSG